MRPLVATAFLLAAFQAAACGVCIDDKIASCYDHAVVTRAHARGEAVAFLAIEGPLVLRDEARAGLLRALEGTRGVQRGTARVSLESAALSFAYDPRRARFDAIRAAIEARLARDGLKLKLLRVLR